MEQGPKQIQKIYLTLLLFNTLAASLIWGINTLFLLDAGLSNFEASAANAFFTAGQVIFEVPTGIIADMWGRRISYLLGTLTLGVSTFLYFLAWQVHAPFWAWAVSSVLIGLGFTFFSGATEAWLVDALKATRFKGSLESVFAKGQVISGIAMLSGSVMGGIIAQMSHLGMPYLLRAVILGFNFLVAFFFMRDVGFTPKRDGNVLDNTKELLIAAREKGFKKPALRWVMLAAPFTTGVGFYVFYATQPYLLELYGNEQAYGIAGVAAAIVAGAQIVGGLAASYVKRFFHRRTSILLLNILLTLVIFIILGVTTNFWIAIALLILWSLLFAVWMPIRQAYLNGLIESKERATILSLDSLIGSSGGVVIQPVLGKAADIWSYGTSYLVSAVFMVMALPFLLLARQEAPKSDVIEK